MATDSIVVAIGWDSDAFDGDGNGEGSAPLGVLALLRSLLGERYAVVPLHLTVVAPTIPLAEMEEPDEPDELHAVPDEPLTAYKVTAIPDGLPFGYLPRGVKTDAYISVEGAKIETPKLLGMLELIGEPYYDDIPGHPHVLVQDVKVKPIR